jgi:hypothetical protein
MRWRWRRRNRTDNPKSTAEEEQLALDGPWSLHGFRYEKPQPRSCVRCGRETVVLVVIERRAPCLFTNGECLRAGMDEYCMCPRLHEYATPHVPRNLWVEKADGDVCPSCAIECVGFDTVLHWDCREATVSQHLASPRGPLGSPARLSPRIGPIGG